MIAIYRGESLASVQQLGATDNNGPPRVAFDGAAGVAYRLAVTAPYQDDDARFRLRVAPAPLPSNDDFTGALPVDAPGRYTGSVADATRELGEPHHAGATAHHSLWYRFRARRTGRLSIQAVSKACGMIVAVYTGTDLSSLHSVGGRMGDTFRFRARRGRVYRIAVDCRYASLGDFELTISDGSIEGKGVSVAPVAGQTVESVLERGLRTVVTARRKVKVGIELRVSPATARRLDLSDSVIGRTSGSLTYNQSLHATLRLTSEAKKALAGAEKLSAVLRLRLLGTDAPNRVLNVPVEIPN